MDKPRFTEVAVAAVPLVNRRSLSEDDKNVGGVYQVVFATPCDAGVAPSRALDRFHTSVPVDVLDDFTFVVFDRDSGIVLPETDGADGYENTYKQDEIRKTTPEYPWCFEITVVAVSEDGFESTLGVNTFAANDVEPAKVLALEALWDERLDPAKVKPKFHFKRVV